MTWEHFVSWVIVLAGLILTAGAALLIGGILKGLVRGWRDKD